MRIRVVAVVVLAPVLAALALACAPKAPAAPDDGWSPKLASVADAGAADAAKTPPRDDLAELADASTDDVVAALTKRITSVGPQHWRVERPAFDLLFRDDARILLRSMRIVPEANDGSLAGMRIYGVRLGGVAAAFGFENGDRIETVNGFSLGSPDQALEIYSSFRKASRVEVRIVRAGKPTTLTYDLVD